MKQKKTCLTALPVYNEVGYVQRVLAEVRPHSEDVLVVDDGSNDGTTELLKAETGIAVVTHPKNIGYGAALRTAFAYAIEHGYERMVTIDCDGQHEPQRIPLFLEAAKQADLVSGSRYLKKFAGDTAPPEQRRWINQQITAELNQRLGLSITDAFCGFKAYRVETLKRLELTIDGYAMPLEFWVQAVKAGFKIVELPVPLIYLDETRSFGGSLDDATTRLKYYHSVLDKSIEDAGLCEDGMQKVVCGKGAG